jgi:uncharacterized membrane protein
VKAKPLTIVITAATVAVWGASAIIRPKMAAIPLVGLLPIRWWPLVMGERLYLLLLPTAIYLLVPVLAWNKDSKKIAWCIPIIPLLGITSFVIQFASAYK